VIFYSNVKLPEGIMEFLDQKKMARQGVFEFFHPVFQWIDEAVNSGQTVLLSLVTD
jgi:hypothetical protein